MTGAIVQLVARGIQDAFIINNPQITYWKIVYRRHTNFSTEAIKQKFIHKPDFGKKVSCEISPNGDLMTNTHLVITLPNIKQIVLDDGSLDTLTMFAWIKKIGYGIIKSIDVEIDGQIINRQYGEWMNIISDLQYKKLDQGIGNMIGDIGKLTDFTYSKDKYTLYVPLQFWFSRHFNLALPLICLHHSNVKINLELNELDKCCTISPSHYIEIEEHLVGFNKFDKLTQIIDGKIATGIFIDYDIASKRLYYTKTSRNKFQSLPNDEGQTYTTTEILKSQYLIKNDEGTFCTMEIGSNTILYDKPTLQNISLVNCYLLVTYVFLDLEERNRFIQNKHDYLIEQTHIFNPQRITSSNYTAKIDTQHPTKFITWVVQQEFYNDRNINDTFNYTDGSDKSLVLESNILFNGFDRLSTRTYKYYSYLQPYNHFKIAPSEGVNVYSYALNPLDIQPSGTCNMSFVGQSEIQMRLNHMVSDSNPAIFRGYACGYNILRIANGISGILFV